MCYSNTNILNEVDAILPLTKLTSMLAAIKFKTLST